MNKTSFPLHPSQYEVYIDQLMNPESAQYNIGVHIRFKGSLDKERLKEAVQSSVELFDAFKMRFDLGSSDAHCYVDEDFNKIEVVEVDLSDAIHPEDAAKSWMQNQINTPFDVKYETLPFEHFLIKLSQDENWFFFKYHHLVTDGYGLAVWVKYITKKYNSLLAGEPVEFTYSPYKEEAIKAFERRNSDKYDLTKAYWKEKIKEKPESVLRKRNNITENTSKKSGSYYLDFTREQRIEIGELMDVTKSNLHQLTVAALLVYFGKISGERDIIFGMPVHKRSSAKIRKILGMFSGVLPFIGTYKEDLQLKELLQEIGRSTKANYFHQEYLISDLARSLKMNAAENSLYDVLINYIPFNLELNYGNDVEASIYLLKSEYEKVPLQICWNDYGNNQPLELALHYSYEYFSQDEIELLANRVLFIFEQFKVALHASIKNIDIVPQKERLSLQNFNGPAMACPHEKTIVDLFEEQVERTPDDIALVFEDQHVSYRAFNERANQVAHYLRDKGVKEETLVPVCMERSVEMMLAIFGILKAGAAYVPVDPEYPQERIIYMLQDTSAQLVLTSKKSRSSLPSHLELEVIELDSDSVIIDRQCKKNAKTSLRPHHLSYVIYTSGSTGAPKGVMIEHRSLVASTTARALYYKSYGSVFLVPSFSFDSSVAVIFGTLLTGGSLILCRNEFLKDINFIRGLLKKVETILCVPSYYRLLLEEGIVEESILSKVIVAGEDLNEQIVSAHFSTGGNIALYNEYGPTEYTIWATVAKIDSIKTKVTIGAPISNTQVYITGKQGDLMPTGVVGEICIAGDGLARGYLNNIELSERKFVSNPFSTNDGSRMYRTGDLGRWLPDGNIEFLGRIDNQVKIRGYRIELGEVESVIQQSPKVKEAVVLAREDKEGRKQLVAYVVSKENEIDREALRGYVRSKLPQYMVPAIWITLQQLPLTPNGKIDRKALPDVDDREDSRKVYEAPRNEIQARLCEMWQQALKVEKVGIYDNFFELGGDSITCIRIMARARELGYSLQPKDLFLYQTIEQLSGVLVPNDEVGAVGERVANKYPKSDGKEIVPTEYAKSLVPAKIGRGKIPLYIVCGGGGTIFTFKKLIELLDPNQPVFVLQQPTATKDLAAFPDDIKGIAARYVGEIVKQNPTGPYALSGHCIGGIVVYEMAKQLEELGKRVELVAMFDTIIIEKEEMPEHLMFEKLFRRPGKAKMAFIQLYLKMHFEAFLLFKHTRHTIRYKVNRIKDLLQNAAPFIPLRKESRELEVFTEQKDTFQFASRNYELTSYDRDIVVFYAKDHYYFLDKSNSIMYRKFKLSDSIKNRWKRYVRSATFHEIEGEHSTMFEPGFGGRELAKKLQDYLDRCNNRTNKCTNRNSRSVLTH